MSEKFMYQVGGYGENVIEKIKILKETDKFVTTERDGYGGKKREQREAKSSSWHKFFITFNDAKNYLILESENSIKWHNEKIVEENKKIDKINSIKEF